MGTIGEEITELTPSRGFSAEFAAAITIVIASKLGLPVSTTHTLVGAVVGVGMARSIGALNIQVIRGIVASWLITVPFAAALAAGLFLLARLLL
jgi:PiT family inorganic phosphate transporter